MAYISHLLLAQMDAVMRERQRVHTLIDEIIVEGIILH
jgi:hypothetical protein